MPSQPLPSAPMPDSQPTVNSLIDMLRPGAATHLDDIDEPSPEELAALDNEALDDDFAQLDAALPSALSMLAELEQPELVSLEGLDDAEDEPVDDSLDSADELPEEDEPPLDDFVDLELDDDELADEGYDLDDEDVESYRDLYGDDDAIIPSFREGEFADDDDGDSAYYEELR